MVNFDFIIRFGLSHKQFWFICFGKTITSTQSSLEIVKTDFPDLINPDYTAYTFLSMGGGVVVTDLILLSYLTQIFAKTKVRNSIQKRTVLLLHLIKSTIIVKIPYFKFSDNATELAFGSS